MVSTPTHTNPENDTTRPNPSTFHNCDTIKNIIAQELVQLILKHMINIGNKHIITSTRSHEVENCLVFCVQTKVIKFPRSFKG